MAWAPTPRRDTIESLGTWHIARHTSPVCLGSHIFLPEARKAIASQTSRVFPLHGPTVKCVLNVPDLHRLSRHCNLQRGRSQTTRRQPILARQVYGIIYGGLPAAVQLVQ